MSDSSSFAMVAVIVVAAGLGFDRGSKEVEDDV